MSLHNFELTGSSHRSSQAIQSNIIMPPLFDSEMNFLRLYVDQRLDAEMSKQREYVDKKFSEINQRIDALHAQVRGGKHGPAIYTDVTLKNRTNDYLTLHDQHNWYGSANCPQVIPAQLSEKIKHDADPQTGCSKGGVAYTIRQNIRWVVAWSNMKDRYNQVYIDIIESDEKIDWQFYQSLLDTSSPKPDAVNKYRDTVVANIDPTSATPLMKATLSSAIRRV